MCVFLCVFRLLMIMAIILRKTCHFLTIGLLVNMEKAVFHIRFNSPSG